MRRKWQLRPRWRLTRRNKLVLACVACVLVGLGVGAACQSSVSGSSVVVNYRTGSPTLTPGNEALVVFRQDLLESLIREGIAGAQLPFAVSNVQVSVDRQGIKLSGKTSGSVLHVPYNMAWSGVAVVTASENGRLAVTLTGVHAFGAPLPSVFSQAMGKVISDRLNREVASMPNFRVHQVEVSDQEMLVYLNYTPA